VKVVILAGGHGTRISEESAVRPKPMVEIGGMPVVWHIMKIYAACGLSEFVLSAGYKSYVIKEYFANYFLHGSDVTFDLAANEMTTHATSVEPWRVTIVDTGGATMTGGRIKRVGEHLGGEPFCLTYGDTLSNVDVGALLRFHREQGVLCTVTAVQPPGRFGALALDGASALVGGFHEKPAGDGGWVNGGYFVCEPGVLDYVGDDTTIWEREPMERLSADGQLAAYRHGGFWHPLDTLRDRMVLEERWEAGDAPWKTW
jgi:glucose-1-phosphate cytidylyltransferase